MSGSWRLSFIREGDGYIARSADRIAGRTPGGTWSNPERPDGKERTSRPEKESNTVGRFLELRDEEGQTLYRRAVTQSLPDMLEYPTGDPDRPFGRAPVPQGKVIFVRVPADERARSAAVVDATAAKRGRRSADAGTAEARIQKRVIAEISLRQTGQEEAR